MKTLKIGLIGFVLGAAVAVGTATVGSEETAAIPCCSGIQEAYDSCIADCGGDTTCEAGCDSTYGRWLGNCSLSC